MQEISTRICILNNNYITSHCFKTEGGICCDVASLDRNLRTLKTGELTNIFPASPQNAAIFKYCRKCKLYSIFTAKIPR